MFVLEEKRKVLKRASDSEVIGRKYLCNGKANYELFDYCGKFEFNEAVSFGLELYKSRTLYIELINLECRSVSIGSHIRFFNYHSSTEKVKGWWIKGMFFFEYLCVDLNSDRSCRLKFKGKMVMQDG